MLMTVFGIVVLVVGLLASVAIHELGHMIPAKRFGTRVSQYFVGFGPTLWSRKRGETEYGIKAIPLGGYVRIVGMIPPAEAVKPVRARGWIGGVIADARDASEAELGPGDEGRAFYELSWWKKVIVMAGGPLTNLVLAAILFTVVLVGFGVPQQTLRVADVMACVPAAGSDECTEADPAAPAYTAGIQSGDRFVSVDGQHLEGWRDLVAYVSERPGQSIDIVVSRDGQEVPLTLTPGVREVVVYDEAGEPVLDADGRPVTEAVGFMGVYSATENVSQPWNSGLVLTGDYVAATVPVLVKLPVEVWHVGRAAFGLEERSQESIMGVVGVGRVAGEIASAEVEGYTLADKTADMLMLIGGMNLALFLFNMIPLIPLDGGHIVSALWQGIKDGWARLRRRAAPGPVDVARMMPLAYGVFGLLIVMTAVLVLADIVAPVQIA